jgi:SAM-dependent methyltransferase
LSQQSKIREQTTTISNIDMDGIGFKEYKPYMDSDVKLIVLGNKETYRTQEMTNYEDKCVKILEEYSCENYFKAKGTRRDFLVYDDTIKELLDASGIKCWGKVLEFGAGICKASAVLSRNETVKEIHALDFCEILLREFAPRVISYQKGMLSKIKFIVGDMNKIDQIQEKYDNVICYGAIHHLCLPENFFVKLSSILNDGGNLFCIQEPALANSFINIGKTKDWIEKIRKKRIDGDNENIYKLDDYNEICKHAFDFELISMRGIGPRWAWVKKDESTFSNIKSLWSYRIRKIVAKYVFTNFALSPLTVSFILRKKNT